MYVLIGQCGDLSGMATSLIGSLLVEHDAIGKMYGCSGPLIHGTKQNTRSKYGRTAEKVNFYFWSHICSGVQPMFFPIVVGMSRIILTLRT